MGRERAYPLCSSAHSHTIGTETGWEDLREIDPWDGTPRSGVSNDV
jgi:hypothetical protein